MKAISIIVIMLAAPFFLYYVTEQKTLALFVGAYVLFSIPSIAIIAIDCMKNKSLPKIVGGPSFSFGKWQIGK